MLTVQQFSRLYPNCKDPEGWVKAMNKVLPEFGISTPKRIASFISQCGHESGGWRVFEENLNYSAKALNAVFPKYFIRAGRDANEYAREPEKIANIVYANRMGNRDSDSGDGWLYRGRGPIQLTGFDNYSSFSKDMNVDVVDNPHLVAEDKEIALMSAIWFWNKNDLNRYADAGDIKGMTKRINGGYNGLQDRIHHYNEAMHVLGNDHVEMDDTADSDIPDNIGVIKRGSKGEAVKLIQRALGLYDDGIFGRGTEAAVKIMQRSHGLHPDGIVGPKTFEKLIG